MADAGSPEYLRITECAAIASARWTGFDDRHAADQAATEAMRQEMNRCRMRGRIVIGEGERDEAPMLYIGEEVGTWEDSVPRVDIAVDPLEGTNLCAKGVAGAIATMAVAEEGGLFHAPDSYLDKIVVGPASRGRIDLRESPTWNLQRVAKAKRREVRDLMVTILDRERHRELIGEVRQAGARVKLIGDGDLSAGLACAISGSGVDAVFGAGGAPEGVLTAVAMKIMGGEIQGRMQWRHEEEKQRAGKMGITDLDRLYTTNELVPGEDLYFIATGVTDGDIFKGVRFWGNAIRTESLLLKSRERVIRFTDTTRLLSDLTWGVPRE